MTEPNIWQISTAPTLHIVDHITYSQMYVIGNWNMYYVVMSKGRKSFIYRI
jgi:hypothetical protein